MFYQAFFKTRRTVILSNFCFFSGLHFIFSRDVPCPKNGSIVFGLANKEHEKKKKKKKKEQLVNKDNLLVFGTGEVRKCVPQSLRSSRHICPLQFGSVHDYRRTVKFISFTSHCDGLKSVLAWPVTFVFLFSSPSSQNPIFHTAVLYSSP